MAQAWERMAGTYAYARRSRILLVGDDPDMRQYLTRLLGENSEMDIAPDISTALDLSRKHMPDLVVADTAMQSQENFDRLWESRRTAWGKVPIILYSTREESSCTHAVELDANCDVIAPFSECQLLALVRAHLGMIQMHDDAIRSLRSAEDHFRTLKTMMTPGVWVASPKGEIIGELAWWWERLTGQTAEQYKGFGWLETVHPDDKPLFIQNLRDALRKVEAYQLEYRVRRHNGAYSYVRSQGAPVLDGEGNLRGWIGTLTNIDEEKKTQEALRWSEERHRSFVAMTSLAVWTASPNGDLSNLRGWSELTGQTPDQPRGSWVEVIHPEDRTLLLEHWQRALREGTPLDVEFRVRQKDGAYAHVRGRGVPLRNPDGSVREWIGTLIDIDERKKMEEAMRASEERYRTLTTATTTGVWNATAGGEIVERYIGWENMTGQTPQQYKGWGWLEVVHPDDKQRTVQVWREALRRAAPVIIDFRIRRRDGSYGYVRAQAAPIHKLDGSVREWMGTIIDIDDQKQAEEALRESEEEFRANFEMSGIGQVQTDPKTGRYVRVNNRFCQMVGYSADELLTMTFLDITHPEDRPAGMCALLDSLRGETDKFTTEKRYIRKDGSILWALVSSTLIHDGYRRPLRTIAMIEDVTERRQFQALSQCQKKALEMVAQGAPLAEILDCVIRAIEKEATVELRASIQILDEEGKQVRLCAAPSLPGYCQAVGLCVLNSKDSPSAMIRFLKQRVIVSDLAATPELQDVARLLAPYAIRSVWSSPIISSDQKVLGSFCIYSSTPRIPSASQNAMIENVTRTIAIAIERKEAEAERERLLIREQVAREQAEVANRVKDEFLAVVSHELRTPLNAINGWTHMLVHGSMDDAAQLGALHSIQRQVRSQCQLIDDLLDIARIVSGKLRLEVQEVDPAKVIAAALDVVRPASAAKQIDLRTELDPAASALSADPERLQQVVWNLLSNAIKFTPAGGRVEIRTQRTDAGIEIVVRDTGQGISGNFLPYVFDRFRQADVSTTRTHGGIGLGLAIVRHLIELHGGTVSVASEGAEKGATFTVRLPVRAVRTSPSTAMARDQEAEAPQDAAPEKEEILKDVRVLVVEDNSEDREVLTAELAHHGATVSASDGAVEALHKLPQVRPDVLVADIAMPGEDGYSLIRKIRAYPPDQGGLTPAIALTAYAGQANRTRALEAGYQKHMTKPADPNELARAIDGLVHDHRQGELSGRATVGAVYDRASSLESTKHARS